MIPHTIVTLYEDSAGHLYIAADDETVAYDVTALAGQEAEFIDDIGRTWREPGHFLADAVALLDGDTADWTVDTSPLDDVTSSLGQPGGTRLIAVYDGDTGETAVMRGADGRVLAGHTGRRYIGHLEGED